MWCYISNGKQMQQFNYMVFLYFRTSFEFKSKALQIFNIACFFRSSCSSPWWRSSSSSLDGCKTCLHSWIKKKLEKRRGIEGCYVRQGCCVVCICRKGVCMQVWVCVSTGRFYASSAYLTTRMCVWGKYILTIAKPTSVGTEAKRCNE